MGLISTPICHFCRKGGQVEVPVMAMPELRDAIRGRPIQEILPSLTPSQREQIISGTHPECWELAIGQVEEDQ